MLNPRSWRSGRNRRRSTLSIARGRRPRVERLEDRRLLAGDFELLKDINTTVNPAASSAIISFVDGGGIAYFAANDSRHGTELWRSDGTEAGTYLVKDIVPGAQSGSPANLFYDGETLYFTANDGEHGLEL